MWLNRLLTSSIGQKVVMSLTGLFLILFLIVHLSGNLSLFAGDGGKTFNLYADFMVHNPVIKVIGLGLYAFIVIHTIQGIALALKNRKAKGSKYAKKTKSVPWYANNMALLGILILAFLFLHMGDFWYKMKLGPDDAIATIKYPEAEAEVKNIYQTVVTSFSNIWIVIAYLLGLLGLSFHLWHGFESAFQTLGLNHSKYNRLIRWVAHIYSIVVPLGFAAMPIYIHFFLNK